MVQSELSKGRNGKHKGVVTMILRDLDNLNAGSALRVPLSEFSESKEKVRSALNRVTRNASRKVLAASDEEFFERVERRVGSVAGRSCCSCVTECQRRSPHFPGGW